VQDAVAGGAWRKLEAAIVESTEKHRAIAAASSLKRDQSSSLSGLEQPRVVPRRLGAQKHASFHPGTLQLQRV
jgi:hypothetical protein